MTKKKSFTDHEEKIPSYNNANPYNMEITQPAIAQQQTPFAPVKKTKTTFYNVPNGPSSNLILETLGAGENIADLPIRKKQISNNTVYTVLENDKSRQISLINPKASITIELSDIDKLTGSNKPAKKLFVLSLIKANEQAMFNGQLTKDYISFPLNELIDIGFYKTPQSAKVGFKAGTDILTSLKIRGHIQQTKNKSQNIDALEVLFTGAKMNKGQCVIYFNTRINWNFVAQYFTILPRYYFKLSNRASDLLYYIFYIARQRTKDIREKGHFDIGFRSLQHRLQLPSEINNNNPHKTIKQPLEDAIEQIKTEHYILCDNNEFTLSSVYDKKANISYYLNNGYLQVNLAGNFATTLLQINKNMEKEIEQYEKY